MTANDKRAERRVPVALRIRLRYSDVDQFISKFAINISRGGMFLSSRNPKPIGTHLHFEMRLVDDSPVIEGSGEVRWIREYDRHRPSQPHGMGIRFFELKPDSQKLIERIIEHRRSVGEPDTDSIPEPRAPGEPARPAPPPPAPAPEAIPEPIAHPSVDAVKGVALAAPLPPPRPPTARPAALPDIPPPRPHPRGRTGELLGSIADELPALDVALARARRLAGELSRGDLERELAELLDDSAAPVEVTVDAASRELAERLGGAPVARRAAPDPGRSNGAAGEPPPAGSAPDPQPARTAPAFPAPPEDLGLPDLLPAGEPATNELPALRADRDAEETGPSERVDPADVLEEKDADDLDVDLSDFASDNDVPTSIGEPVEKSRQPEDSDRLVRKLRR